MEGREEERGREERGREERGREERGRDAVYAVKISSVCSMSERSTRPDGGGGSRDDRVYVRAVAGYSITLR